MNRETELETTDFTPKPATMVRGRNRSRFEISLGHMWRQYARERPGLTFLGTIQRGMHIGALAFDGESYFCVNGNSVVQVTTRKVLAALDAAERQD